jgi:Uma2 family endonuclease
MSLDEFIRLYDNQPFELVNDIRNDVLPQVAGHAMVVQDVLIALDRYADSRKLGDAWLRAPFVHINSDNTVAFSYTPDVMYFRAERMASYKQAVPDWKSKPYLLIPDLAVEVVAHDDNLTELDEKVDRYLLDGVLAVWVLDPQRKKVFIHTLTSRDPFTKQTTTLKQGDTLNGGEVIPGFEIALATLFE